MCGIIAGLHKETVGSLQTADALKVLRHRGPDDEGCWEDPSGVCVLGHRRLSIIDLSSAGHQPFSDASGRYRMVFNGEIYNYIELKNELSSRYQFATKTDTEVLLAAYIVWGEECLDRLVGMFAFAIWDTQTRVFFAARDRFGVKPLFYAFDNCRGLQVASEIKALHTLGVPKAPDAGAWCAYFRQGLYDHSCATFWKGISRLMPGHMMRCKPGEPPRISRWYDLAEQVKVADRRPAQEVQDELLGLFTDSMKLRFRADVPVGICLSGGLDSSLLLGLIHLSFPEKSRVQSFTFYCADEHYDETPWVDVMLRDTCVNSNYCLLKAQDVPSLASAVQDGQDEPFGGLPTLGMACVHARAKELGVTVLLDGNGVDEGWAGYDYYRRAADVPIGDGPVQGTAPAGKQADMLLPEFAQLDFPDMPPLPFDNALLNLQYRDLTYAKIPRAMRFADRVSMQYSRELREPFLDHRLIELGLRQPETHRISNGQGKWLVRQVAANLMPQGISEAPKRPVQTPQREWLRGPLADWAGDCIEHGLAGWGGEWLDVRGVRNAWQHYVQYGADNSFPVWQWINLGLMQTI